MPQPFDDDSIGSRIERLVTHLADNLTDRHPTQWPGWIVRLYGKIDGIAGGQIALLQEFQQLRSMIMAQNDRLTAALSDLNDSLGTLASDKTAAEAEVADLHTQVTDLQSQLAAAADNTVDPAVVDQIVATATSLKDKISNFNVPDPVTTPPASTDPSTPVTDPSTPVSTDPSDPAVTPPATTTPVDPTAPVDPTIPEGTTTPSGSTGTTDTTVDPVHGGIVASDLTDPTAPVVDPTDPSTPVAGSGTA